MEIFEAQQLTEKRVLYLRNCLLTFFLSSPSKDAIISAFNKVMVRGNARELEEGLLCGGTLSDASGR